MKNDIERFIALLKLDESCSESFRKQTPQNQHEIMAWEFDNARNPSAVVYSLCAKRPLEGARDNIRSPLWQEPKDLVRDIGEVELFVTNMHLECQAAEALRHQPFEKQLIILGQHFGGLWNMSSVVDQLCNADPGDFETLLNVERFLQESVIGGSALEMFRQQSLEKQHYIMEQKWKFLVESPEKFSTIIETLCRKSLDEIELQADVERFILDKGLDYAAAAVFDRTNNDQQRHIMGQCFNNPHNLSAKVTSMCVGHDSKDQRGREHHSKGEHTGASEGSKTVLRAASQVRSPSQVRSASQGRGTSQVRFRVAADKAKSHKTGESETDKFVKKNKLDRAAADKLHQQPHEKQRSILQASFEGVRNPSAFVCSLCIKEIKDIDAGNRLRR